MQKRNLGKSMKVSSVGLGCMGITHASGTPLTKAEGMKVLESALEIGYNFFDTAECYTGTNPDGTVAYNEEVVGAVLKPVRRPFDYGQQAAEHSKSTGGQPETPGHRLHRLILSAPDRS